MTNDYLDSIKKQFAYYKMLGEKAMAQIPEEKIWWQYNGETNSIAIIVKHLCGNMLSRWTDFLTSDGEKEWRDRDTEFDNDIPNKVALVAKWDEGWKCLFDAIEPLTPTDLAKEIYIRNMGHTVVEAINRQMAHYPYHIGQMVFIAKMACSGNWESLSIQRGKSTVFNAAKFANPMHTEHFTDELMKDKQE